VKHQVAGGSEEIDLLRLRRKFLYWGMWNLETFANFAQAGVGK